MRIPRRRPTGTPTGTPTATPAKQKAAPIGTPTATPDPRIRKKPTGTPKPTGTSQRLGLTRAELQKQKQRPTATSAGPTAAQKAKLVAALKAAKEKKAIPTAKPDPRRRPTGTPKPTGGIRGATQAQLRQIRQRQQSAKPITPAQRAAIRKARPTGTPRRRRV